MKVSARNVLRGTVATLIDGPVSAEVGIDLAGGERLTAVVSMESARSLELGQGKVVVALIKASWVMLTTASKDTRLSARNGLSGTVKSVVSGAVNTEVTLALTGGTELHAVVTKEAVTELGLKPGTSVTAVIKASSVVLGVPA